APGTYDIEVKQAQALSRKASNVTLAAGSNPVLNFGTLLTGDVNNSNAVSLSDYAILRLGFGKCTGEDGFDGRADLNGSGGVTVPQARRLGVDSSLHPLDICLLFV